MDFYIAQLIGAGAVVAGLSVYQFNKRRTMLQLNMTASLLNAVHYFMLSATTGGISAY